MSTARKRLPNYVHDWLTTARNWREPLTRFVATRRTAPEPIRVRDDADHAGILIGVDQAVTTGTPDLTRHKAYIQAPHKRRTNAPLLLCIGFASGPDAVLAERQEMPVWVLPGTTNRHEFRPLYRQLDQLGCRHEFRRLITTLANLAEQH
ncbi:hypothetical protein HPT27_05230 [Permianibacter sp. IMCC34836]|uniref:hypothetical protein n=1 Tax=Permianibacter fluminis TaxID=2738515 RepID=UPI001552EE26|nr:hypothetical protein [Permianibacter fluminis]NQD36420.1 hypothetical protein [Permianibacter fluminis]